MEEKEKITLKNRLQYNFDNFMASGPRSIFLSLLILFIVAFVFTSLLRVGIDAIVLKKGGSGNMLNDLWLNFLMITDPGAIAEDGENPIIMKTVGIISTFLGLVFFSAVIAFITTQLDLKIALLKKGKSQVVEKDHVIILGWGLMVVDIIRELIEANLSEKKAAIVVMSETPKEEMDEFLSEKIPCRGTTRIITRTGKVSSLESLYRVGITESKSVIILPECNESALDDEKLISDAKTLKAILGVVAASKNDPTRANIIAEIFDQNKRDVMVSLDPERITMVDTETIIARIIVQTSRTSGLAFVYDNIIGFSGSEIYFYQSQWESITFGELPLHFEDGIPIGVSHGDESLTLNPPADYTLNDDDSIVIIAEDDSTINFKKTKLYEAEDIPLVRKKLKKAKEKELLIGWNSKAGIIVDEYNDYILSGSIIDIILPVGETEGEEEVRKLKKKYPKIKINILKIDPLNLDDLKKAHPEKYDNVIILNRAEDDTEKIDSTTITTLLLIKEIFNEYHKKTGREVGTQLISEVMNSENLELVVKTGVNDSIISNQMISKILAQVAENPEILHVYDDLFSEEGSEIYLKPVDLYMKEIPPQVTFVDLMLLAQKRNEILIGYRKKELAGSVHDGFGIFVNIPKDQVLEPKVGDCLVVLAEDEL